MSMEIELALCSVGVRCHDGYFYILCHDMMALHPPKKRKALTRGMIDKDGPLVIDGRDALSEGRVLALCGKGIAEEPIERVCAWDVG
jgi:hypothetical protein